MYFVKYTWQNNNYLINNSPLFFYVAYPEKAISTYSYTYMRYRQYESTTLLSLYYYFLFIFYKEINLNNNKEEIIRKGCGNVDIVC